MSNAPVRRSCLVTGGAGFIGCAISAPLAEAFEQVVAVDNLHPQVHADPVRPAALDRRVRLIRGDITEAAVWEQVLAEIKPEVVVHLAAETGTGQSLTEATRHAKVNVAGTTRMMDALVGAGATPGRIVLTSSRAVYGEGAWQDRATGTVRYPGQRTLRQFERGEWDFPGLSPLPVDATTTQPHPTSVYGATKLAQELVLKSWAQAFDVELGILRLQNVYGPGQSLINSYTGIVSLFAQWAREGRSIPVYEDGRIGRDFVFIDDVTAAITRMARGAVPSPVPYDVGSGVSTTVEELAGLISAQYGAPAPHINGRFRNGDVRFAACSIVRTVAELGWSPQVPLATGLGRLARWIDGQAARMAG